MSVPPPPSQAPTAFLDALERVARDLSAFEAEVSQREEQAIATLQRLQEAFREPPRSRGHAVAGLLDDSLSALARASARWGERLQAIIAGRRFIDHFDRHAIVLVYGKVNSGKSSLGNFLAGLDFSGMPGNPYESRPVAFLKHATADEPGALAEPAPMDPPSFPTQGTECTREIQTFQLGGLAWVDTPGIHSMTAANQALARQYVDHAELVVFLSSSDAPCRASDMLELQELLVRKAKPVLMLVSRFDEAEEDVDECGQIVRRLIPKTERSRREQSQWLREQLQGANLDGRIEGAGEAFVSVYLAREAIRTGDAVLFEHSGMNDLYAKLARVLTEEATRLKQQAPRRRFDALLDELLAGESVEQPGAVTATASEEAPDSIIRLNQRFEELDAAIATARRELESLGPEIARRVRARVTPRIEGHIRQAAEAVERGGGRSSDLQARVTEETAAVFQAVLEEEVKRVLKAFEVGVAGQMGAFAGVTLPEVEAKYDQVTISEEVYYRRVGNAVGGGVLGIVGTAVGGMIAGPLGAIVGGALGTMAGSAAGGEAGSAMAGTRTASVQVGTNGDAVLGAVLDQLSRNIPREAELTLRAIADDFFGPLATASRRAQDGLQQAGNQLEALRFNRKGRV